MSATVASDVPTGLSFVDPNETDDTYRVCLWAAPGQGKSVAAASAPTPIVVLSADRPSAYRYARKHHGLSKTDLRETRWKGLESLAEVYRYLRDNPDVRTVILDPFTNIVDAMVDIAPTRPDGDPNYQWSNKKLLDFIKSLRAFDINVILVAHEKINDGQRGDGKLYPALGGPALINKILAELDICAHIERVVVGDGDDASEKWIGRIQPVGNLVCKDSTGALGDRRIADLSRWFEVASEALKPDESDIPFSEQYQASGAGDSPADPTPALTPGSAGQAPEGRESGVTAGTPQAAVTPAPEMLPDADTK